LLTLDLAVLYDIKRSNSQRPIIIEAEIERTAKRNRKTKAKEKQGDTREESPSTSSFLTHIFQEDNNMSEEQGLPPRRTLGDYVMYQGSRHFSNIVIPATAKALEKTCFSHSHQYPSIYINRSRGSIFTFVYIF